MYYHNGVGFEQGETITEFDGLFGHVVVKYDVEQFDLFFNSDGTPKCIATLTTDSSYETGKTVYEAVKKLYEKEARYQTRKDCKLDTGKVNGEYKELVTHDKVWIMVATQEDPRLCARKMPDGKGMSTLITDDNPITLERCQELTKKIGEVLGETVTRLRIEHRQYAGEKERIEEYEADVFGEGDWSEWVKTIIDRTYRYNAETNGLLVLEDDEYLYSNDDGEICDDPDALADSLSQQYAPTY